MTAKEGIMSSISRRSLLGYSGTAAAGAALATAGTTQAAAAEDSSTAEVMFPPDTEFTGGVSIADIDAMLRISFTVQLDTAPAENTITPADVANALSELAVSRGWPPIHFSGRPAPVAIN